MRTKNIIIGGILVIFIVGVAGYFLFPKQYPTVLLPKLSQDKIQKRCSAHTSQDTCESDPYCASVEMTPVCIQTPEGQNCLPGGYFCSGRAQ
jgi:hypothetical protein